MNPARAAREAARAAQDDPHAATAWTPPVLRTVAAQGDGIEDVLAALDRHFAYLEASGTLRSRRRERLRERVVESVERKVRERLWGDRATAHWLDARLTEVERGGVTPFAVADELLERSGELLTQPTPAGVRRGEP